jgi:hypothetical protein
MVTFSIRSDNSGQAKLDGPKRKGNWNRNIKGGRSQYYATIFRAAYHYYYGNIQGLRRPPKNSPSKVQMKISAMNKEDPDAAGMFQGHIVKKRMFGIGNQVKIWTPGKKSSTTYSCTIHELAHASHWNMDRRSFNNSSLIVWESWACGVQVALTRMVYPKYTWKYSRRDYTGIVQDMLDGIKIQGTSYWNVYKRIRHRTYADLVSGYTIRQIEDALKGKRSWNNWKESIKEKYKNETEEHLDAAFTYWNFM